MKKIALVLYIVVTLCFLAGCSEESLPPTTAPEQPEATTAEPTTTEPITTEPITTEPITTEPITTEPITTTEPATEPAPTEPPEPRVATYGELRKLPGLAMGGDRKEVPASDLGALSLADLPIYFDTYPVDETGPLYPLDDTLRSVAQKKLDVFLTMLLGPGEYTGDFDGSFTGTLLYMNDDFMVFSGATMLSINTHTYPELSGAYPISTNLTLEELWENELLVTAMEYAGLKDVEIQKKLNYSLSGEVHSYEYLILPVTEGKEERVFAKNFHYIHIDLSSFGAFSVSIRCDTEPATVGEMTLPTMAELDAYVAANYPEARGYVTEVYYERNVAPGYYIPCVRLYLDEGEVEHRVVEVTNFAGFAE